MTAFQSTQTLKERLHDRQLLAKENLSKKHPHAQNFFDQRGIDLGKIRQHSARLLTAGALAGTLFLNSPTPPPQLKAPTHLPAKWTKGLTDVGLLAPDDPQMFLVGKLKEVLPEVICPLGLDQENQIGLLIERFSGIRARGSIEGRHLNTCYGFIGAEQHLPRFPGDTISQHDEFQESGITPGLGAWGYFAPSKVALTPEDIQREKYYVAVQTLYLPDWNRRTAYLREWYKYRKVLVTNPKTGQSVVADVADAGPAAWTGKQFGGSPEVMYYLGLDKGPRKGAVLLLFVDDLENKVPLGPVDFGKISQAAKII